jgi:hypothetical protein
VLLLQVHERGLLLLLTCEQDGTLQRLYWQRRGWATEWAPGVRMLASFWIIWMQVAVVLAAHPSALERTSLLVLYVLLRMCPGSRGTFDTYGVCSGDEECDGMVESSIYLVWTTTGAVEEEFARRSGIYICCGEIALFLGREDKIFVQTRIVIILCTFP